MTQQDLVFSAYFANRLITKVAQKMHGFFHFLYFNQWYDVYFFKTVDIYFL